MKTFFSYILALCLIALPCSAQQCCTVPWHTGATASSGGGGSSYTAVAGSVTGCYNETVAQTACVYALRASPGAGGLVLCQVVWQSTTATASLVGSSNGAYTAIGSPQNGAGGVAAFRAQLFKFSGSVNVAETVTLTTSAPVDFLSWECAAYAPSGAITADGITYSGTDAVAGVATVGPLSTTGSTDLLFAACGPVSTACTLGAAFTSLNDTNSCLYSGTSCASTGNSFNAGTGGLLEYQLNVTAGSHSATFGMGTTDSNILGLAAFK
jgi:hypothetical protein